MNEASVTAYTDGQRRLAGIVAAACDPDDPLAVKVEASLGAAFSLLSADPGLAFLLTIRPERAADLHRLQSDWHRHYGSILRHAAAEDGAPELPFFLEPALIAGIGFAVAQYVRRGEASQLLTCLLPTARWYLLSYYLPPEKAMRLGVEALPDGDRHPR